MTYKNRATCFAIFFVCLTWVASSSELKLTPLIYSYRRTAIPLKSNISIAGIFIGEIGRRASVIRFSRSEMSQPLLSPRGNLNTYLLSRITTTFLHLYPYASLTCGCFNELKVFAKRTYLRIGVLKPKRTRLRKDLNGINQQTIFAIALLIILSACDS